MLENIIGGVTLLISIGFLIAIVIAKARIGWSFINSKGEDDL
jgi:hypothetical protein